MKHDFEGLTSPSSELDAGQSRRTFLKGAGAVLLSTPVLLDSSTAAATARRSGLDRGAGALLRPVAVTSTTGNITGAEGLLHGGEAILRSGTSSAPVIVLDYGRLVGGHPVFEISRVEGAPTLKSIYAQALPWLLPDGDGPAPGTPDTTNAAEKDVSFVGIAGGADLSRVELYPVTAPGVISNRLVQGGQRFQALTLVGKGAISLRLVGFVPTFRQPTRSPDQGSFSSSDAALNEIWALGAYTLDAASLPVGSVPAIFQPTNDGMRIFGNAYSGLQQGRQWTDYTATFDVQIIENELSWLVRGTHEEGIRLVLCASDDTLPISTPNSLRIYVEFSKELIANVELSLPIRRGRWYQVSTTVVGMDLSVTINGQLVAQTPFPLEAVRADNTGAGWFSFGNAQGAEALVRNLQVVNSAGATLYQSSLRRGDVDLNVWLADSNELPGIVDGATRDRLLFTGDLGIASLSLLYTNFDLPFLEGSIRQFASYQDATGAIATSIPPQANPGKTPNAFPPGIPDYTVHHITTTFNYWRYTGDKAFLARNFPVVQRVLAYLDANTDPNGLFAPGGSAAQTLANAHWYGALQAGAQMAHAAGQSSTATAYLRRASLLRDAINAHLFNTSTGLYGTSTSNLTTAPEDGNSYAVLFGVTPPELVPQLLANLAAVLDKPAGPVQASSGSSQIGPFTAGFEALARFEAGLTTTALDLIRLAWGHMRRGGDFYSGGVWEYVALDGTPGLGTGTSLAHPWASAPTPALSKYVLGIRPLTPGYATWLAEPQPGDLQWAEGTAPTPRGPISLRWERSRSGQILLHVHAPRGTTGFVGLPVSGSEQLTVDGRLAPKVAADANLTRRAGYAYAGPLRPGPHSVSPAGPSAA